MNQPQTGIGFEQFAELVKNNTDREIIEQTFGEMYIALKKLYQASMKQVGLRDKQMESLINRASKMVC